MPLIHFNGHNFTIPHIHESQNLKKYFGGDIQKFSEKLPGFVWSRYPGEKHDYLHTIILGPVHVLT